MTSTTTAEARRIVEASAVIHPDWTPPDHLSYLINDEMAIDANTAAEARRLALIERWMAAPRITWADARLVLA